MKALIIAILVILLAIGIGVMLWPSEPRIPRIVEPTKAVATASDPLAIVPQALELTPGADEDLIVEVYNNGPTIITCEIEFSGVNAVRFSFETTRKEVEPGEIAQWPIEAEAGDEVEPSLYVYNVIANCGDVQLSKNLEASVR